MTFPIARILSPIASRLGDHSFSQGATIARARVTGRIAGVSTLREVSGLVPGGQQEQVVLVARAELPDGWINSAQVSLLIFAPHLWQLVGDDRLPRIGVNLRDVKADEESKCAVLTGFNPRPAEKAFLRVMIYGTAIFSLMDVEDNLVSEPAIKIAIETLF